MRKKTCKYCGKLKSINQFHKNNCKKDGLEIYCKSCVLIKNKVRRSNKIDFPNWICEHCGYVEKLDYEPTLETLRWHKEICKKCGRNRL